MDSADTVIDVDRHLSKMLEQQISRAVDSEEFTIFRVPECARKGKDELFEPSVVSIGPFHRGKEKLRLMEEHKRRCLRAYLSRNPDLSIESLVIKVRKLEDRARRCYCVTVDLNSDDFVIMLLLDGCFLVEYFFDTPSWYTINWSADCIEDDVLMMENQIPFFVLEELWDAIGQPPSEQDLRKMVTIMSDGLWKIDSQRVRPDVISHLLHLCYHYIVPDVSQQIPRDLRSESSSSTSFTSAFMRVFHQWTNKPNNKLNIYVIPSASELCDVGIKIKVNTSAQHKLHVTFNQGILEIPVLDFEDSTKRVLANILVYEQCDKDSPQYFTSFLAFMDNVVNSAKDVLILERSGVIMNSLSGEEEIVEFFNEMGKAVRVNEDHYLAEMNESINRYCRSSWHHSRGILLRDYFSNPWTIISLMAGIILLILTCIQTFYAVYSYYVPQK